MIGRQSPVTLNFSHSLCFANGQNATDTQRPLGTLPSWGLGTSFSLALRAESEIETEFLMIGADSTWKSSAFTPGGQVRWNRNQGLLQFAKRSFEDVRSQAGAWERVVWERVALLKVLGQFQRPDFVAEWLSMAARDPDLVLKDVGGMFVTFLPGHLGL